MKDRFWFWPLIFGAAFLSAGCQQLFDQDSSPSNTRSFNEWTVGPGHPWDKQKEERRKKKEQNRLEKEMIEDEEEFRKEFPKNWN